MYPVNKCFAPQDLTYIFSNFSISEKHKLFYQLVCSPEIPDPDTDRLACIIEIELNLDPFKSKGACCKSFNPELLGEPVKHCDLRTHITFARIDNLLGLIV